MKGIVWLPILEGLSNKNDDDWLPLQTAVVFSVVSQLKLDLEMKTIKIFKADTFYHWKHLEKWFSNEVAFSLCKIEKVGEPRSWNSRGGSMRMEDVFFCIFITDRPKPMTIRLNLKVAINYQCHRVTDANFGIGCQTCIGCQTSSVTAMMLKMLPDSQSMLVDGGQCSQS